MIADAPTSNAGPALRSVFTPSSLPRSATTLSSSDVSTGMFYTNTYLTIETFTRLLRLRQHKFTVFSPTSGTKGRKKRGRPRGAGNKGAKKAKTAEEQHSPRTQRFIENQKEQLFTNVDANIRRDAEPDHSLLMTKKRLQDCHFLYVGNQDVELIPKTVANNFPLNGLHFFPHHDGENENPYPDILVVPELINPSFTEGHHDLIVFNQKVEEVITTLNFFFTIEHFFDGKGFIFVCKDGEKLLWKVVHDIVVRYNILHLIVYVPQEETKTWNLDVFSDLKCYVSGNSSFYTYCFAFLIATIALAKNLTYIGSGMNHSFVLELELSL